MEHCLEEDEDKFYQATIWLHFNLFRFGYPDCALCMVAYTVHTIPHPPTVHGKGCRSPAPIFFRHPSPIPVLHLHIMGIAWGLQSLPKENIHFCQAEYSKLRGATWKVGGVPNPPLSWSKLGQASFWKSKKWLHTNKNREETLFRNIAKLQNSHWPPYFSSSLPWFWVLEVYTFFRWRLYSVQYTCILVNSKWIAQGCNKRLWF